MISVLPVSWKRLAWGWLACFDHDFSFDLSRSQNESLIHGLVSPIGAFTTGPWTPVGVLQALTVGGTALRPGGQTSTVTHCCSAPRPPFWLLVTQTVCFSETLSEFSADLSLSARYTLSRTEMAPWMVKVLFLAWMARAAWAASAHSQQVDWQIWLYSVSGTAANSWTWVASTCCW